MTKEVQLWDGSINFHCTLGPFHDDTWDNGSLKSACSGILHLTQDRQTVRLEIEALRSKSAVFSPSGPVKMVGVLDCSALGVESFQEEEVRINGMHIPRNWYTNHNSTCLCTLSMDTGKILETSIAEAYCVPDKMWNAKHQKSLLAAWVLFLGSLPFGVSWANETTLFSPVQFFNALGIGVLLTLKDSVFVFPVFYVKYELKTRWRNWWDRSKCPFCCWGRIWNFSCFRWKWP